MFIIVFLGAGPEFARRLSLSGYFFYSFAAISLAFFVAAKFVSKRLSSDSESKCGLEPIERSAMFIAIVFWVVVHSPLSGH